MFKVLLSKPPNVIRETLTTQELTTEELVSLYELDEKELKELLFICGVVTYNELPLAVCTKAELTGAYMIWRNSNLLPKRREMKTRSKSFLKWMKTIQDYIGGM